MKIVNFIFKLSVCLLVVILFEGLVTLGEAFNFNDYTTLAWIVQVLIFNICVKVSLEKWY